MSRQFAGELIGTFILVLFGCGAVAGDVLFGAFGSLFEVAMIWGIGVALGIFASRNLSQAHLNPAVTAAMLLAGNINRKHLLPYLSGQLIGAFLAGVSLLLIFEPSIGMFEAAEGITRGQVGSQRSAMMFGEYYPNPGFADKISLSIIQAMILEAFGTLLLVGMILLLTHHQDQIDNTTPLFIGLTVSMIISLIAPFTQAGLNPARDLGPRLVAWIGGWGPAAFPDAAGGWFWVYILGPVLGGLLASSLFRLMSKKQSHSP
ncbi:MAG: MIP/aquaporin family protein [Bacteroidota bacterium]